MNFDANSFDHRPEPDQSKTFGPRFPRMLDWVERRQLAEVIGRSGLTDRLVNAWNPTQCTAMAVFVPMQFEGGHWVEVQPPEDPARKLSVGVKVHAYALEKDFPEYADGARGAADGYGQIANLLGDEATLGFRSEADHRQLKTNLSQIAHEVRCFETQVLPTPEMDRLNQKLFDDYFQ